MHPLLTPSTHTAPLSPCWHCHFYGGLISDGAHARRAHARGSIQAAPAHGCAYFEREPGADDEPDQVPGTPSLLQPVIEAILITWEGNPREA
jgi:hypothetical protein